MLAEHPPPSRGKFHPDPVEGDRAQGRPDVLVVRVGVRPVVVVVDVVGIVVEQVRPAEDHDPLGEFRQSIVAVGGVAVVAVGGVAVLGSLAVQHDAVLGRGGQALVIEDAGHVVGTEGPDVVVVGSGSGAGVDPRNVPGRVGRVDDGDDVLDDGAGRCSFGHHGWEVGGGALWRYLFGIWYFLLDGREVPIEIIRNSIPRLALD